MIFVLVKTGPVILLCYSKLPAQHGFGLSSTASLKQNEQRVTSTLIRQALEQDQLELAAQMLGRPFSLMGRVRHGQKVGRQLGFPTANVWLYRKNLPVHGVYAIEAVTQMGRYHGVANIGCQADAAGQTRAVGSPFF